MSNKAELYKKVGNVMKAVERVPKNGYNSFHKYHYTTESDLVEAIRGILHDNGLAFFSSQLEQERDGEFTKVKMEFTLADVETGETLTSFYWGEGQDKGDKGLYKAATGATKYFLMKTFLIPTGDDPEADEGLHQQKKGAQPQKQQQNTNTPPRQQNSDTSQNKASDNQIGFVNKLITDLENSKKGTEDESKWTRNNIKIALCKKEDVGFFESTKDLTSAQASAAIKHLQAMLGGN